MRISDWSSDVCSSDLACVLDKLGEYIADRVIEEAGDSGDGGRIDLAVDRGWKGHLGLLDKWKFSACSPPPLFPDRRRARSKPSIILGEHDREHAPRERCVRWIFRSEFEGGIIIVDLEEDAFAPK